MPEGPSLIILKEKILQFKGRQIMAASGYTTNIEPSMLTGKTIIDIKTWGKHLLICFNDFTIRVHMMLLGSYKINEPTKKNASLHLQFSDGDELNFSISNITLIDKPLNDIYDWSADIMNPGWDTEKAIQKLQKKPGMMICDVLLDQKIFSGVGNIIKNEALFMAKIHPASICGKLPEKKLKELIHTTVDYSFDFLKWKQEGTLSKHFKAYDSEICPRNNIPLQKADLGKTKRHCFFCNKCQKLYS